MFKELEKNWLYRLLVINTLESISRIETLVEGVIVGTFGVIFGGVFYVLFQHAGLEFSAQIAWMAFLAYLAVTLFHFIKYVWDREKREKNVVRKEEDLMLVLAAGVVLFFVYFILIDQALSLVRIFHANRALMGSGMLFLNSLPGLIVLMIPLALWEKLCKWTPVDEVVRWILKWI